MEVILGCMPMTVKISFYRKLHVAPSTLAAFDWLQRYVHMRLDPMGTVMVDGIRRDPYLRTAEITPAITEFLPLAFVCGDTILVNQIVVEEYGRWYVVKMSWSPDMLLPRMRGYGILTIPHSELYCPDRNKNQAGISWRKGFMCSPSFGKEDATIYPPATLTLKEGYGTDKLLKFIAVPQDKDAPRPYLIVKVQDLPGVSGRTTVDVGFPAAIAHLQHPMANWSPEETMAAFGLFQRTLLRYEHARQKLDAEDQKVKATIIWGENRVPMLASFNFSASDPEIKFRPRLHDPLSVSASLAVDGLQFGGKSVVTDLCVVKNQKKENEVKVTMRLAEVNSVELLTRGLQSNTTVEYCIQPGFEDDLPRLYDQLFRHKLPVILSLPSDSRLRQIFNMLLGRLEQMDTKERDEMAERLLKDIPNFEDLCWADDQDYYYYDYLIRDLPLTVFEGPPGTGKSILLAALAYLKLKLHLEKVRKGLIQGEESLMILLCAPSNRAADRLAQLCYEIGSHDPDVMKVLRLYAPCREVAGTACAPFALHEMAVGEWGEKNESAQPLLQEFREVTEQLTTIPWETMTQQEKNQKSTESNALARTLIRLRKELQNIVMNQGQFNAIITTMVGSQDSRLEGESFTDIILDEVGQSTIPEALLAISKLHPKHGRNVVMAGDRHQLRATILSTGEAAKLLGTSFMADIPDRGVVGHRKLGVSWRMHPSILDFPSRYVYDGRLVSGVSAKDRSWLIGKFPFPIRDKPIVFIQKKGPDQQPAGFSRVNYADIGAGTMCVKFLKRRCGMENKNIGNSTFYQLHRSEKSIDLLSEGLTALTVDSNQGAEYDVAILECVRSAPDVEVIKKRLEENPDTLYQALGFIVDPGRMNVALTRAKHGLIVIGDPDTLELDKASWAPFIDYCYANEFVIPDYDLMLPYIAQIDPSEWYDEDGRMKVDHLRIANTSHIPFLYEDEEEDEEHGDEEEYEEEEWEAGDTQSMSPEDMEVDGDIVSGGSYGLQERFAL